MSTKQRLNALERRIKRLPTSPAIIGPRHLAVVFGDQEAPDDMAPGGLVIRIPDVVGFETIATAHKIEYLQALPLHEWRIDHFNMLQAIEREYNATIERDPQTEAWIAERRAAWEADMASRPGADIDIDARYPHVKARDKRKE